jgi:hypothetical protein|tara:strand:- start:164 stop:385 length:222 start_codon:yes stop_codon:yes gene_type:complete
MSVIWVRDKLTKHIRERKEDVKDTLLAGVKDMAQYEYLRGRYSSLVDVEMELRELLGRVIQDDQEDEQQGNST